ncbi:hypothetical protein HN832_00665 [archaeon]|jgi:hypothetical protein|nr:hypothetical protein [archaeon]MBT4373866.1 hypothetical protein [archaeon]MBT4532388.1 hypothetical protein [archaeon]MBT7001769.1 hypothetical protein [archaeon]MBT7281906.1 hypothetical protein [archaeon]
MVETILQHPILANFALPFLLIFFIVFAILEKTKVLGEGKTQLNALTAFVLGLVFVGAVFPKEVVNNMVLFLTVAMVVVFVTLLLWGFATGGELKESFVSAGWMKYVIGAVIFIAVIIAVLWATGVDSGVWDLLFKQDWSSALWTNVVFIVVIAGALAIAIKSSK